MKLINISEITGKVICVTGLHIGAGDMEMRIGGVDNPVIKHPYTNEPYIPGSSLKGKIRSLLEMESGLMGYTEGAPVSLKTVEQADDANRETCQDILRLFGSSGADSDESRYGPTRASFSDCSLDKEWMKNIVAQNLGFTEVKSENSINRIKGTAENPRFMERVTAGAQFRFSISLKQMESDKDLLGTLLKGMKLLEYDALGGSGSRGYGRISFVIDNEEIRKRFEEIKLFNTEA